MITQTINPLEIGYKCNKVCYVWRENYCDLFNEYTDFTTLIYYLTGKIAPPGLGGGKLFKQKVKFVIEKEDGQFRACIMVTNN